MSVQNLLSPPVLLVALLSLALLLTLTRREDRTALLFARLTRAVVRPLAPGLRALVRAEGEYGGRSVRYRTLGSRRGEPDLFMTARAVPAGVADLPAWKRPEPTANTVLVGERVYYRGRSGPALRLNAMTREEMLEILDELADAATEVETVAAEEAAGRNTP